MHLLMRRYTTTVARRNSGPRSAAALVALVAALALTGCGADEQQGSTLGGGVPSKTDADSTRDPGMESENADADGDLTEEDLFGEACLHGDWLLDNESMRALFVAAGGDIVTITGSVVMGFAKDGTTLTSYDEWTTVAAQDDGTVTMVRNGVWTGARSR